MPDWLLLHNPRSRFGARAARRIRSIAGRSGGISPLRWVPIGELAAVESIPERLIVLGGDGTVNAAASWLIERGAAAPLAILPAGTGNNLARGIGIPLDLEEAFRLAIAGGRERPLDAIFFRCGGENSPRVMIQSAALGFPAQIAARYDALRSHRLFRALAAVAGTYIYRLLALAGMAEQKGKERRGEDLLEVRCSLPGEELRETALAVFIGNERSLGGKFHPCPRAEVDDGALDLCLVRARAGVPYTRIFRRVLRGRHLELERAVVYRQTRGPVELELSMAAPLVIDGDLPPASDRYRIEVLPGRLRVIVPAETPAGER